MHSALMLNLKDSHNESLRETLNINNYCLFKWKIHRAHLTPAFLCLLCLNISILFQFGLLPTNLMRDSEVCSVAQTTIPRVMWFYTCTSLQPVKFKLFWHIQDGGLGFYCSKTAETGPFWSFLSSRLLVCIVYLPWCSSRSSLRRQM